MGSSVSMSVCVHVSVLCVCDSMYEGMYFCLRVCL